MKIQNKDDTMERVGIVPYWLLNNCSKTVRNAWCGRIFCIVIDSSYHRCLLFFSYHATVWVRNSLFIVGAEGGLFSLIKKSGKLYYPCYTVEPPLTAISLRRPLFFPADSPYITSCLNLSTMCTSLQRQRQLKRVLNWQNRDFKIRDATAVRRGWK